LVTRIGPGRIHGNSLLNLGTLSFSSYHSVGKRFGPQTEKSLLFPVPETKIAEFGHKVGILSRKSRNSLEISLFLLKCGAASPCCCPGMRQADAGNAENALVSPAGRPVDHLVF
jgi:hypothetical protein